MSSTTKHVQSMPTSRSPTHHTLPELPPPPSPTQTSDQPMKVSSPQHSPSTHTTKLLYQTHAQFPDIDKPLPLLNYATFRQCLTSLIAGQKRAHEAEGSQIKYTERHRFWKCSLPRTRFWSHETRFKPVPPCVRSRKVTIALYQMY